MKIERCLLDTSVVVDVLRGKISLRDYLSESATAYLCDIVVGELLFGATRSQRPEKQRQEVEDFLRQHSILHTDFDIAQAYAEIKSQLEQIGQRIPENDMWIASFASVYDIPLFTHDKKHFERVQQIGAIEIFLIET
ncbi:MAG: PIN domain-containing protein [Fimbriimonadales bacterium]|nr:PIN domain-containing protein [Fimbriimonadales bacterium]